MKGRGQKGKGRRGGDKREGKGKEGRGMEEGCQGEGEGSPLNSYCTILTLVIRVFRCRKSAVRLTFTHLLVIIN
jgi:hypothetical protein